MAPAGAATALQRARAVDFPQVGLQAVHAPHQPPAIDLELGLTGPPGADPSRLLAEATTPAPQARQPVAQQGQLDLGLAFGAAGVLGEDVKDHRRAVDGGTPEHLLQVPLLGRTELLVEDDRVRIECAAQRGDLLGFAAPDERGRLRGVPPLHDAPHHVCPGTVHQLRQLVERLVDRFGRDAGEDDAHQDDALAERPVDQRPGQHVRQESIPGWMSMSATLRTGPARNAGSSAPAPSVTSSVPPGLRTRTGPLPSSTPQARAAAAAATLPVPQASVSPAPRSHTRRSRSSPSPSDTTLIHSTLIPPVKADCNWGPSTAMSTLATSGPHRTRCGLPTSTVRALRSAKSWG